MERYKANTTRNLLAGGMLALFENPAERRKLQGDLDRLLSLAVEEMLRYVSPVVYMRRTAICDTTLDGKTIHAGDKVVMYYGSANRDESVFAEPDRFDVARSPNDHIAFGGGGTHFCLGAHIARIEIQVMLREILTRLPDIEAAGPAEWLPSNSFPDRVGCRFVSRPVPPAAPERTEVIIVCGAIRRQRRLNILIWIANRTSGLVNMKEVELQIVESTHAIQGAGSDASDQRYRWQSAMVWACVGFGGVAVQDEWWRLVRDDVVIMFLRNEHLGSTRATATQYIYADDVMGVWNSIEDRCSAEWSPEKKAYGTIEFAIRDPRGYLLSLGRET